MASAVRYGRVKVATGERWARLEGDSAVLYDAAPWSGGRPTSETIPVDAAALVCPVAPASIFAIGRNYRAHAAEMKGAVPAEPLVFMKAVSSLAPPRCTVLLPRKSTEVHYEAELGVVIGRACRRVPVERALEHVFGYTALCDVTARDLQNKDGQWARAKSFDTFCPAGPVVVTDVDPANLAISLRQNGELRQSASTSDMVFDVARLVSHVSSFATLSPGDLIATGTPEGVGPLSPGDRIEIVIAEVGELVFSVARES